VDLKKNFADFQEFNFFTKLKTFKKHIFKKILSFINLSCGHVMLHKKFGPDRFSRFDVYWIQTNRQTPRQTSQIYRLVGRFAPIFYLNCEHVLFVYILKQRRKKCCGFKNKIRGFSRINFFLQN